MAFFRISKTIYSRVSSESLWSGQKALSLPDLHRDFLFKSDGRKNEITLNGVRGGILQEYLVKGDDQRPSGACHGAGVRIEGIGYLLHHCRDLGALVIVVALVVLPCALLGDSSKASQRVGMGPAPLKLPSLKHDLRLLPLNRDDEYDLHLVRIREPPFQIDVKATQVLG